MAVDSKKKGLQKGKSSKKAFKKKVAEKKKVTVDVASKAEEFSNISDEETVLSTQEIEEDEGNYDAFMEGMASLEGSKRFLHPTQVQETEEDFEYGLSSKASLESLLAGVANKKTKKAIRKSYSDQVEKHKDLKLASSISTPEQEKVDRKATYQRAQKELAQWDSVVHSRRSAPSLSFPLVKPNLKLLTSADHYKTNFEAKTPLEAEVMSLLRDSQSVVKPNEELTQREKTLLDKMTLKEALEKRKELMRLRSLQSYQEIKIRRQNKIKSKTYRKILRKEKRKDKLRELELLHATNPELAAEKLEEMEKIRIEERATLKHRNASKFLQFQSIRSKNNKESREVVQEQLRKHREMTTKLDKATMDSDEEEEVVPDTYEGMALPESTGATDDNNPWIQSSSKRKADNEVNEDGETFDEFTSSYKKFWSETNKEKSVEKVEEMEQADEKEDDSQTEEVVKSKKVDKSSPVSKDKQGKSGKKRKRESMPENTDDSPLKKKASESGTKPPKSANEKNQIKLEAKTTSIEERERLELAESIDDLFCEAQSLVKEKMKKKMKLLKADIKGDKTALESEEDAEGSPEVFEELAHAESLKFETDRDHSAKVVVGPNKGSKNIDPSNFIEAKKSVKQRVIGEAPALEDDEEEEEGMRQVIAEAFADDDVIEKDFKAEKDALLEANKTQVINKVLPGWGSWGGDDIKVSKKKIRRFTFKAPPTPIRKDANKGHLILNENKNSAVLEHQVSNVPFPFRSVKDYEASIRTPVGETFVPRTVFKRLTKPKTKTSAGVIIEPMDKEELVKRGLLKNEDDLKIST